MKTEELKKERLSPILYEIAAEGVPNSRDLWPSIRAHLKPNRRRVRLAALRPATRLGWAVLALATILTVSTVAYAVVPVVSRLFQQEVGLRDVEQAGLSQTIDRSQTIDGITVTLEQGYAAATILPSNVGMNRRHDGEEQREHARFYRAEPVLRCLTVA